MNKKQIVFLGSKPIGYQCLEYLIREKESLGLEITGILSQERPDFEGEKSLAQLAEANNIPLIPDLHLLPECDILYSVQYHKILKTEHIGKARERAVNLHMAPLPEYRGSNQFSYAILEDKEEFGTTIHLMDERIDHGDILFQKRFPIPPNCWVQQLYQLTFDASIRLFRQTLRHIVEGIYTPLPQADLIPSKGTSLHYRHEIVDLKRIDLNWDKATIEKHIRATMMSGFEPPYCEVNKQKIYFTKPGAHG